MQNDACREDHSNVAEVMHGSMQGIQAITGSTRSLESSKTSTSHVINRRDSKAGSESLTSASLESLP